jgi:hypothetical protein
MLTVYPTVAHASANVVLSAPDDGSYIMQLINAAGVPVIQHRYQLSKGTTYFSLDVSSIPAGNYWLYVADKHGNTHSVPIIKQ